MSIRTILVDDEPLATQGLQLRLQAFDDVEVVATAANGREAIRQIKTNKPDLVFLDIQMPGFDGFSVIQGLMDVEPPLFVFVTAYGDHALRAFEAQAVDYLMKPVDEDRLAATLDRVRQRLAERRSADEAERLKEALAEHAPDVPCVDTTRRPQGQMGNGLCRARSRSSAFPRSGPPVCLCCGRRGSGRVGCRPSVRGARRGMTAACRRRSTTCRARLASPPKTADSLRRHQVARIRPREGDSR